MPCPPLQSQSTPPDRAGASHNLGQANHECVSVAYMILPAATYLCAISGWTEAKLLVARSLQVWFAFSGNGSQWPKMGLSLLEGNPTFHRSVQSSAAVLVPKGIDLMAEFRAEKGWKTPLLGAVGLLAVQIGLVDVLKEDYGIVPDGMMGHSAGEGSCLAFARMPCKAEASWVPLLP